jgi:phosphoribosylaminoimidazolecarboxamide formyltransferase/IMP cyclohydrolase
MATDGCFRTPEAIEPAARAGVRAVIQSGGGEQDGAFIEAAEEAGIAVVFTGIRHFRH